MSRFNNLRLAYRLGIDTDVVLSPHDEPRLLHVDRLGR